MYPHFDAYFSKGPSPNFTPYHIWKVCTLLMRQGPISRRELANTVGIGEGSIRTILKKMANEGAIESSHRGVSFTSRGQLRFMEMGIRATTIELESELAAWQNCAVLTSGTAHNLVNWKDPIKEIVKAGAEKALVVFRKGERLVSMPRDYELDKDDVKAIENAFEVCNDDTIIIGFSKNYENAEKGAVSFALALCNQSSMCWEGRSMVTKDDRAEELESLALAIHEVIGKMPLGMRSKNEPGVRCEDGYVIDRNYTGPNLEKALATGKIVRAISTSGPYAGAPVVVVPIVRDGETIAALGIIDFTKLSIYDILGRIRGQKTARP